MCQKMCGGKHDFIVAKIVRVKIYVFLQFAILVKEPNSSKTVFFFSFN